MTTAKANNLPAVGRGHPRRFKTDEDYQSCFVHYIEDCQRIGKLPNISGFCVYADITRETFYLQKDYYIDTHEKIRQALEDALVNHQLFGHKNPAMAIVQGKNTFKWDDRPNQNNDSNNYESIDADDGEIDVLLSKLGYSLIE